MSVDEFRSHFTQAFFFRNTEAVASILHTTHGTFRNCAESHLGRLFWVADFSVFNDFSVEVWNCFSIQVCKIRKWNDINEKKGIFVYMCYQK